jgi:hypothetical protein
MSSESLEPGVVGLVALGIGTRVGQLYILSGGESSRDCVVAWICGDVKRQVLDFCGTNLQNQFFFLSVLLFLFVETEEESLQGDRDGEVRGGLVEARLMLNIPMVTLLEGFETLDMESGIICVCKRSCEYLHSFTRVRSKNSYALLVLCKLWFRLRENGLSVATFLPWYDTDRYARSPFQQLIGFQRIDHWSRVR